MQRGLWKPNCHATDRLAVIIAYRNRDAHLRVLLKHLHPFLQRQQADYGIYVVDQVTCSPEIPASSFTLAVSLPVAWL